MTTLREWVNRLWGTVRPRQADRELEDEIRVHLEFAAEELQRRGYSPEDARRAARLEAGGAAQALEALRDQRGLPWLDALARDVKYGLRSLRRSPGFTAVAILTLALGIGVNTAVFSLVNGLILRPLPVREPQRLVTISSDLAISRGFTAGIGWNYAMWDQLRQRVDAFDGAFAWSTDRFDLAQGGEIQPVDGVFVSGDFFLTLGVQPLLGRSFTTADDVRGGGPAGPVAVISYRLWQRRFGGAASIIGTPLVVNGVSFTIVGVMPSTFFGIEVGRTFDVMLPLATEPLINGKSAAIDQPRRLSLIIVLRLKPGQSLEGATATVRAMQPQILGNPAGLPPFMKEPFTLTPAAAGTSGASARMPGLRQQYERPLLTLQLLVGVVLLIACVNLTNLLLARAAARRHEFSVRIALGAPAWRLAQQLLVESCLLAGIGAIAGVVFASWGSRALATQLSTSAEQVALPLSLDWPMMAFLAAVTIATALIVGMAPALRATRVAPIDALKEPAFAVRPTTGWRGSGRSGRMTLSTSLVIAQVALSLVLAVAAGLLIRTFERLGKVPLGFDLDRVLLIEVDTARVRIDPADRTRFYHQLVSAVAAVPGVSDAAGSLYTPGGGGAADLLVDARGRSADPQRVISNFITPDWFAAYGISIRAGRDVADYDTAQSLPIVIVNDAFVRRFFPDRSAIGEGFVDSDRTFLKGRTVVGVVGDVPYGSLHDPVPPTIYVPLSQSVGFEPPGRTTITLSVHPHAGSPVSLVPGVAAALTAVDRDLAFSFQPLRDQLNATLLQERLLARLSGFFGVLALFLSGLGLYGVTSYAATRRRTEIGIRMALGAQRADVIRLVVRQSILVTGVGIVLGMLGATAVTRYLEALLFGVTPLDPITFIGASLMFGVVATVAAYLPARRAARVDPMVALRCE